MHSLDLKLVCEGVETEAQNELVSASDCDFIQGWYYSTALSVEKAEVFAREYSGKLDIYKVNVDNEQELASFFRIRSVPTLLFVPMEGVPQINAGAPSKADLKRFLDSFIG